LPLTSDRSSDIDTLLSLEAPATSSSNAPLTITGLDAHQSFVTLEAP
jgi:hypothetical protein